MIRWATVLLAGAAVAAGAAIAAAAPIPVQTLITDFNVITSGSLNEMGPDIQGPILIGGNLTSGAAILNSQPVVPLPIPVTGLGEVNVFGNVVSPSNPLVGTNSVVLIGGTNTSATFGGNNAALSVLHGNVFPFNFTTDIFAPLVGFSTSLAGLAPSSTLVGETFTGVPNANGVAVFSVPLSQLNSLTGTLVFAGCLATPTPCDAVINVTGTGTFTQGFNYGALTAAQSNLIWNFESGITGVTIEDSTWFASVLATNAMVTATHVIEGNVIAGGTALSYSTTDETHLPVFDCSDNLCTTSMPEPGSLGLLGVALASLGLLRRRRA